MGVVVDDRALRPAIDEGRSDGPALNEAIADLRYGSIGVNLWHALSFALGTTVWGAYPGHAVNDIQSGRGFVGNAYMFARPQKSVVRGPFVCNPPRRGSRRTKTARPSWDGSWTLKSSPPGRNCPVSFVPR